tara:strand:- start:215 stop:799 length:585 start_codon:yes stop_codon:yes gene_type:complete
MNKYLPVFIILGNFIPNFSLAAAKDVGFFDLNNTNTVVLISFLLFVGLLVYLKVPSLIASALDNRVELVNSQIQKAVAVKEESVELLAEVKRQETKANEIVAKIISDAKATSKHDLDQIEVQLSGMVSRKLKATEDQIRMAEESTVNKISHRSTEIAVKVASSYLINEMSASNHEELITSAIGSLANDIKNIRL